MGAIKIRTPVEGYSGTVAGVTFVDGAGETSDSNAVAYFRRHGYHVGDGAEAAAVDKPLEKMTVKELRAYATSKGVDLGDASKKADILHLLTAGEEPAGDEDGQE